MGAALDRLEAASSLVEEAFASPHARTATAGALPRSREALACGSRNVPGLVEGPSS